MSTRDESRPVREEDAFDVEAVAAWLREHTQTVLAYDLVGTPEVRQFPGGASNLTYLLSDPAATSSCAARPSARRPGAPTTWAASTTSRRRSPRSSRTSPRWSGCVATRR